MTGRDCLTLSLHAGAQRKDHVRTQQEGGQGESCHQIPSMLTPWSQTSSLQDCWGINLLSKSPSLGHRVLAAQAN